jgi:hypothetical protein
VDELITSRSCHPTRTQQGWACDQWRTAPGDWFCGLCGMPLPAVALRLDPPVGPSSGKSGADKRRISIVCERTVHTRNEDQGDFELVTDISDPQEENDAFALPLDPSKKAEQVELGLENAPGGLPFDITVGLRHVKNRGPAQTVLMGSYDYPTPVVVLDPPGPIALPRTMAPFVARLSVSGSTALALSARLEIPNFHITIAGRVEAAAEGSGRIVHFNPSARDWSLLGKIHGPSPANLLIAFRGIANEVGVEGAKVERMTPPDLQLLVAGDIRGLAGRCARVAVLLRNAGGTPALIESVSWTLTTPAKAVAAKGSSAELSGRTLPAQDEFHEELRPALAGAGNVPLRAGLYRLAIEIAYSGGGKSATESQTAEIEVCEDRIFDGIVCVDFGTTDTAATIIPPGDSYFLDRRHGQTPRPLELGLIGVSDRPSRFFLPTRAAVGADPQGNLVTLFADEALKSVGTLTHGRIVDRLKWRLGANTRVDGYAEELSIKDLAVGYLKHVRALIEEHPAVASRVESVVATRPARFGGKDRVLISAFREAGMEVDPERFGEGVPPMVSESWPPVLFAVPIREEDGAPPSGRLLKSLLSRFPGDGVPELLGLEELRETPHCLCTFDIGGGSTDVSLLRLQLADDQMQISDVAVHTDEEFAGEAFRDLIVKECAYFLPDAPYGDVEGVPRGNLEALRNLATEIQNFPNGPFRLLHTPAEVFFAGLAAETAENQRAILELLKEHADLANWPPANAPRLVQELWEERRLLIRYTVTHHLDLKTETGAPLQIVFAGAGNADDLLAKLLLRIILRFAETYGATITARFKKLAERLDREPEKGPVHVLLTGRGSLFPLAEALIFPHAMRWLGIGRAGLSRVSGQPAKAVTSWGGAALRAAREATDVLEFRGLSTSGYALYVPPGIVTGAVDSVPLEQLTGAEDDLWGIQLDKLPQGFARTRRLIAADGQDESGEPEALARLDKFNLANEVKRRPKAWVVFDAASSTLEIRDERFFGGGESGGGA